MAELTRLRARIATLEESVSSQEETAGALGASETRYRRLFEAARDGILILDADTGAITAVNPFLTSLLGYAEGDVVGKKLWEIGPFKNTKLSLEAFEELQTRGYIRYEDLPLQTRNGRIVQVEFVSNVYPAGGETVIQCNIRDITERKKAEAVQERLIAILEATPDLVGTADLEGRLVYLNRAGRKMVGLDDSADLGDFNIRQFYDAAHGQRIATEAIRTAVRKGHWSGDTEIVALDGRAIAVSQVVVVHNAADGTLAFTSTIARDITTRRAEAESLRLQSAAVQAAADAVVVIDRNGAVEWVNPAFTEITGYAAEEAVGKRYRDLVWSNQQTPAFCEDMWETILAGKTWRSETVDRRKDGRLYTGSHAVTPITDVSGGITHFVAIHQDVTDRVRLEGQFRQAQKMESVGQLASGIAHDFNNLLTVINGMSDLVLARVRQEDPVRADVEEIRRSGERAATLTGQLLAFSRQQVLAPQVLSLNDVVTGVESLLRRLLGEDIDLTVVTTRDEASVKVDQGQFEQVITNLAVNARDAMPRGGQLTFETQTVTFDGIAAESGPGNEAVPPGAYVRLVVTDTGTGMDEAIRARAFEPFFTSKGPGKGTGLGLATVYGIVKQSQGFIRIYSEVGAGTSVSIYLPRVSGGGRLDRPAPSAEVSGGTETILLVEDNAGLRTIATRFLEPAGYTVIATADGEEALRVLEHRDAPVQLLFTDVVMPGMGGRLLVEECLRIRPEMKVLYMSGYTSDTIVRHGVLEAQVSFLNKPFTEAALLSKVREVLDSQA